MGIEILGGRILAPEFGSSVYTWGSVIGVFMTALGLGYYTGGKRADSHASYTALSHLLVISAVFVGFMMVVADQILAIGAALPVGTRYTALFPATILFGPPVFLLGVITPYAAQLSTKQSTGEASGNVFAIGTFGSIVGAFATTFLLIPYLSVQTIQLFLGLLLAAGALLITMSSGTDSSMWHPASTPLLVAALLITVFVVHSSGTRPSIGDDVVYDTQTPYQEMTITDSDGVRTMYLNDHPQSAMYLNDSNQVDDHVFSYTRYFHLPFLMWDDPDEIDRVLFIGGGGFTGPKDFVETHDVEVDVVEIDPEVVDAAETYFDVEESEQMNIHVMDGREYLQQTDTTYDMIVLDAYKKDSVPFHLTTEEFMELARDRLDEDGILFANIISARTGSSSQFYRSTYRTMQQVFPAVHSFPTSRVPVTQNIQLIAVNEDEPLSEQELQERNDRRDIGIDLEQEIQFYEEDVATDDVPVLQDNRAPVDALLEAQADEDYVIEG